MLENGKIWLATDNGEHLCLLPEMANRHGLIAGATGTGKTTTLKVMIEGFAKDGIPTFVADVKGDIASLYLPGQDNANMQERIARFGITNWQYQGFPIQLWDIFGTYGLPVKATISSMGPDMLSRLLNLTDVQEGVLSVIFHIADDKGLILDDLKDLRAMLQYVSDNRASFSTQYGNIAVATVSTIQRILLQLEDQGGDAFFGQPQLDIMDWLTTDDKGQGTVNILHCAKLIQTPQLYSMFLLWMLGELFNRLPEVGDLEKPKIVFFFDEAHLLFKDTPAALEAKIEQVVKLIRSKGVGVYFCTQGPNDIPNNVLAQLSNRVQHALRAYTPEDQKAIKAAIDGFRQNPQLDAKAAITELKTGEALVSFLQADGSPSIVQRGFIMPPQSKFGAIEDSLRNQLIASSPLRNKYSQTIDRTSAYESLQANPTASVNSTLTTNTDNLTEIQKENLRLDQEEAELKLEQRKAKLAAEKEKLKNGYSTKRKTKSTADKMIDAALTTGSRTVANKLVRGILGNLFK